MRFIRGQLSGDGANGHPVRCVLWCIATVAMPFFLGSHYGVESQLTSAAELIVWSIGPLVA